MNELDDLFRQELDGHASEPAADLWARLQARTQAEAAAPGAHPVDAQFRAGLAGHATPPRRALWERLEDEHLRPRQRRRPVVAWGRLAVAASLLLFVLAGGAGLWWGRPARPAGPVVATAGHPIANPAPPATQAPATLPGTPGPALAANQAAKPSTSADFQVVSKQPAASPTAVAGGRVIAEKNRKYLRGQATATGPAPSSSSVAGTGPTRHAATARRPVPGLPATSPVPDAAPSALAQGGGRTTPAAGQPAVAASEPAGAAALAAAPGVIEVEVRHGGGAARPAALVVAAAPGPPRPDEAAPARARLRLGGLLRQAGHALRGESVSLAEATGLPESVTVQARLGDRVLSKTIQL